MASLDIVCFHRPDFETGLEGGTLRAEPVDSVFLWSHHQSFAAVEFLGRESQLLIANATACIEQ